MEGISSSRNINQASQCPERSTSAQFDYWDFVNCSQCMLPYLLEGQAQPSTPFWATQCGHVLCNRHLSSDKTCPTCGTQNISVSALQKGKGDPINSWFQSLAPAMEDITATVRFQQDSLAKQVRYYRDKCLKQKEVLERVKMELGKHASLKRAHDELEREVNLLRERLQSADDSGSLGTKRQRTSSIFGDFQKSSPFENRAFSQASSSPKRRIATPSTSSRLTLPRNQNTPMFTERQIETRQDHFNGTSTASYPPNMEARPSGSMLHQFAYNGPSQSLSYDDPKAGMAQSAQPLNQRQAARDLPNDQFVPSFSHRSMPPPATPSRFDTYPPPTPQRSGTQPLERQRFRPAGMSIASSPQTRSRIQPNLIPQSPQRTNAPSLAALTMGNRTQRPMPAPTPFRFGGDSSNRQSFVRANQPGTPFNPGRR